MPRRNVATDRAGMNNAAVAVAAARIAARQHAAGPACLACGAPVDRQLAAVGYRLHGCCDDPAEPAERWCLDCGQARQVLRIPAAPPNPAGCVCPRPRLWRHSVVLSRALVGAR
jgi:hypothetical protein